MSKKNKKQQSADTEEKLQKNNNNPETTENSEPETAPQEDNTADDTDKIAELEAQISNYKEQILRQAAEFDNYRKRTRKEISEYILNGGEKILTALLPVLDDMERAEKNIENANDVEALKEGLNLIFKKLMDILESNGLKKINTDNADFNTDYHEAIAMIPAPSDEMKGKVIDCVQTGYKLNDKVIRHAKVAIGQ